MEHRRSSQYDSDKESVCKELGDTLVDCDAASLQQKISEYSIQRQQRIELFLQHIRTKHRQYLEQICPHC